MTEWEEDLKAAAAAKVGDRWFRYNQWRVPTEVTVAKLTPKQIVFSDGHRVTKSGLTLVGGYRFSKDRYAPWTQERADKESARLLHNKLNSQALSVLRELEGQLQKKHFG